MGLVFGLAVRTFVFHLRVTGLNSCCRFLNPVSYSCRFRGAEPMARMIGSLVTHVRKLKNSCPPAYILLGRTLQAFGGMCQWMKAPSYSLICSFILPHKQMMFFKQKEAPFSALEDYSILCIL